ncbi:hypothetical protein OL548_15400 [Lysinibacillus sp. MHQ-1]|nr:hypothetical protein OL548_15400 [Lysinibacillus sp. MHQ-1]
MTAIWLIILAILSAPLSLPLLATAIALIVSFGAVIISLIFAIGAGILSIFYRRNGCPYFRILYFNGALANRIIIYGGLA